MGTWLPSVVSAAVLIGLYFLGRRQDDARRWHTQRMEAYAEFMARLFTLMRAPRTPDPKPTLTSREQAIQLLLEYRRGIANAYEAVIDQSMIVELLCDESVRAAKGRVMDVAADLVPPEWDPDSGDPIPDWDQAVVRDAYERLQTEGNAFIDAARLSLQVDPSLWARFRRAFGQKSGVATGSDSEKGE